MLKKTTLFFMGIIWFLMPALALAGNSQVKTAGAITGGIFILFFLIVVAVVATTIFWILMLVHAATKEVENKALWLIIIVFLGFIGAIVYYFAIKRPMDEAINSTAQAK